MIGTWRLSCGEPLRKRGETMGSIVLQGREPFDCRLARSEQRADCHREFVVALHPAINELEFVDDAGELKTTERRAMRGARVRSRGAGDLHRAQIGARLLLGRERERGLQRFHIRRRCAAPSRRNTDCRRDARRRPRDRASRPPSPRDVSAAIGGSRVDCMTPQKAIRTVFFSCSSAAIVSSSVGPASLHASHPLGGRSGELLPRLALSES